MSLPIANLLRKLAGESRQTSRARGAQRVRRGVRQPDAVLLATEPLEARSMLAVMIALNGTLLTVTQDNTNPGETVQVKIGSGTVPGATGPVQATGITILGNTATGSPILTGEFTPFNDPVTGAVIISGVSLAMLDTASEVRVVDGLAAVTTVGGGGAWSVGYGVGGGGSGGSTAGGVISINSPSKLDVETKASDVAVNGAFNGGLGWLTVTPASMILSGVSGTELNFATTGAGAIKLAGQVTAANKLTIRTEAAFDVSNNISAATLDLTVNAGATQSGGSVTASTFSLTAPRGGVTFNKAGNNLGTISSITADGQDIVLNTTGSVGQTGAILARSLALSSSGGSVTLTNALNKLDSVAISAAGDIQYRNTDAPLRIGVGGIGLSANGGAGNVTVTTKNDLTQLADGAILASQFSASLPTGTGGTRRIALDSPSNQIRTFLADTDSGGGAITLVNAPGIPLTVGDGTKDIQSGGTISISSGSSLTLASALKAAASITLSSVGDIQQNAAAKITAFTLLATNNNSSIGEITLDAATGGNDVAQLTATNKARFASNAISFTGSGINLEILGTGLSAAGGDIVIDANGRKLAVNSGISTVGGNVTLIAANGITQGGGGISANRLTVKNDTSGEIVLNSATNDVVSVAISNNAAAGEVQYTDANDLTLGADGTILGINAGDGIKVTAGGNFLAPAGTGLTAGAAGSVTVAAVGTVDLSSFTTAGAGASISGSGITVNSAIAGGAAGSVKLVAVTTGVTVTAPVTANQDVVLTGPTSVTLNAGAAVTATTGQISIASSGGGFSAAAGIALNAGTDVTIDSKATANVGGPVTSGTDVIVTSTNADVSLGGVVNAGGQVSLTATSGAVSTKAAIIAGSFGSSSAKATTLGSTVTTVDALAVVSSGSFTSKAALSAGGALSIQSNEAAVFAGTVQGSSVTLKAGTATSAAGMTLKNTVTSTTGPVDISAADALTVAGISADGGTANVTLSAVAGIDQVGAGIQAAKLVVTNTTSGAITLSNAANDVATVDAKNSASGAELKYADANAVTIGGASTNNGGISLTAGGAMTLGGAVSSGTADTELKAAGAVSQGQNAPITANTLGVNTSGGGAVSLSTASNKVAILHGQTQGGAFNFTAAGDLQIGVANTVNLVTAGADIYVAAGQAGTGKILLAADSVDAGAATLGLQAKNGISDQSNVTIKAGSLVLANTVSGNITLSSTSSAFDKLAAQSVSGSLISIIDSADVTIEALTLGTLNVMGLQAPDGTIVLSAGKISQDKAGDVVAKNATFVSTDSVSLAASVKNDVANLAVEAVLNVSYKDASSFAVGVGGKGVVTKMSNIDLSAGGGVTLNAEVSTGFDTPDSTVTTITASGAIIQNAGQVISGDLVLTADEGDISLPQAGNDIANLRASTSAGSVTFVDADEFEVGLDTVTPVPKPIGVTAALNISLTAGPTIVSDIPFGLLRISEGLSWLGSLSLKAGLNSRVQYVDFAVTSVADPVPGAFNGSIRNMIEYSNANAATQTINGASRAQPMRVVFDEASYAVDDIQLTRALPRITKPLDIDGTMSVTSRVGINGAGTGTSLVNGLVYAPGSNDSRVNGLAIYGFTGSGIQIASAGNSVTNTYAGLQRDGTTIAANKIGIELTGRTATTNTIGTVAVDELAANVIGGNTYAGIVVRNGATANAIVGNYIGTDSGNSLLGNAGFGVSLEAVNGNVVGTRNAVRPDGTVAASNVIANNNGSGVRILNARAANASLGNLIENNLINANGGDGVQVTGSAFQTIGGQQARQANVITGQLGSPTAGGNGISVTASNDISIFANYVGVDEVGRAGLGNLRAGVLVDGSVRTVVSTGNRIGQNATGVSVRNNSTGTRIEGNFIGTNEFDVPLGNLGDGIAIDRSVGNFVRLGNVIANSVANGVNITDASAATLAAGNVVSGNTIRANATGVRVAGGARTTIGGTGLGNVITSNTNDGILVETTTFTGSPVGVTIQGNFVGTGRLEEIDPLLGNKVGIRLKGATSTTIDGRNVIANAADGGGVRIEGSSRTTVGSTSDGAGNVITTNTGFGVVVTDQITGRTGTFANSGNNVFGNTISGNTLGGVFVRGTTTNGISTTSQVVVGRSTIPGLPQSGRSNTISGNNGAGVTVDAAQGVLVQGNSIFGNAGIPISIVNNGNLGAVGPTLTSATITQRSGSAAQVTVEGTFATAGTGTVTVVNGRATFSTPQPNATVGSVVMINGVGHRISQVISSGTSGSTIVQLQGNPSTVVAGTGRVAANRGVATFSVRQAASIVNTSIIVAGRSYLVTSLSADGRTARLAGNPTFLVSSFSAVQSVSFGLVASSVLGQQYAIDLYLNAPGDGNPTNGTGYGMRTFLGQVVVTVGLTGPGTFSATVTLPAGIIPVGQFITATASTIRAAAGTSPLSTSQSSMIARQLAFATPGTPRRL